MDFDEAATMTKAGYVVDDAFLAFEELKKQKDEEWDWERPTRTNFSSEPLKTTLKDMDLGDKREFLTFSHKYEYQFTS